MTASVTIRLIFVNHDGKHLEITAPLSWSFKELKKHILTEKWPENYVDVAQVERLRLFCSGRELEDPKSVNDLSAIASAAGFAAVHVTVVNKSAKGAVGTQSDDEHAKSTNKCLCSIM